VNGLPAGFCRIAARVGLLVVLPAVLTAALLAVPFPALEARIRDPGGIRILDRRGGFLSVVPAGDGAFVEKRVPSEIPEGCRELFVRLEDRRFFQHPGVDLVAVSRAVADAALGRGVRSGASTITMQLARMVSPPPRGRPRGRPRGFAGKLGEMATALRIEARLPKQDILGLYLNLLPFGRNSRGIGAAAWTYFGQDLSTLSLAQLLTLAVIPRNPTAYDPFRHPDALIAAAARASTRYRLGIDADEIARAVISARSARPSGQAPHFARYVVGLVTEGKVASNNGAIRTTLEPDLNRFIEGRIRSHLDRYRSARITNAAAVVLDNSSGEIIGWVGSRDFNDPDRSGQIDGVLIRRQSASTLKPFLYARALEKGWTAASLLPDADIGFGSEEIYRPVNFDRRSRGPVRLRTALASSLNVPAVYMLSRIGVADFMSTLRRAGFALPADAEERDGLGAAVGNVEVSLLELTRAFAAFPRGGTLPLLRVVKGGGDAEGGRVFSPETAWTICSILSDPSARASGFGTRTYFRTAFPSMFKSGTSSEFTNLWCVGATPRYTVGAWAGNFDGRAVINTTGSVVPARIVAEILECITSGSESFAMPAGMAAARVCSLTGARATPLCPAVRTEHFSGISRLPAPCAYHSEGGRREELLEESFLRPGEKVRILFPVDGEVFYRDETAGAGVERIPILVASRQGTRRAVSCDGRELVAAPDGSFAVAVQSGLHVIIVKGDGAEERVSFSLR
jgi:penicillin-binding protein 1C